MEKVRLALSGWPTNINNIIYFRCNFKIKNQFQFLEYYFIEIETRIINIGAIYCCIYVLFFDLVTFNLDRQKKISLVYFFCDQTRLLDIKIKTSFY